ncbi:hypothetical protein IscW_ISCW023664 [Ixodes scapularis]|uniref:Uncharacterized protein n=1 Tax=Ixodes scapularis TaxID=6945 RepID=B7QM17_IXOSC|nr:hypothetical protein IscW_ISCW023664 [Ixodes scapularis]|eukprot:XP_002416222.1 hypothetical protein IscW_ISCW023664 [Ixodes scapularis]
MSFLTMGLIIHKRTFPSEQLPAFSNVSVIITPTHQPHQPKFQLAHLRKTQSSIPESENCPGSILYIGQDGGRTVDREEPRENRHRPWNCPSPGNETSERKDEEETANFRYLSSRVHRDSPHLICDAGRTGEPNSIDGRAAAATEPIFDADEGGQQIPKSPLLAAAAAALAAQAGAPGPQPGVSTACPTSPKTRLRDRLGGVRTPRRPPPRPRLSRG